MADPEDPWAAPPPDAAWATQPDAYTGQAPPRSWTTPAGHTEYEGGTVYLLHFIPRLGPAGDRKNSAGHYRGKAAEGRLDARLAEHAAGLAAGAKGAKITRAQVAAGGTWRVYTQPGGSARERQLKQRGATRTCPDPDCQAETAAARERDRVQCAERRARARQAQAEAEAEAEAG